MTGRVRTSDPLLPGDTSRWHALPATLAHPGLTLAPDGLYLSYDYDTRAERTGIARLLADVAAAGLSVRDLATEQSSLEDVFLRLVEENR
jgi:ABC-2 type transport system ATP-binding protein